MGTDEVEYSNVTETEHRMGCGLGRGGHWPGDIPASSPGGVRDKEEFYRALFSFFLHAGSLRNLPANLHRDVMKLIVSAGDCRILDHGPATVEQILTEQGINPLEVIVSRNGRLIPEDTVVEAGDEILITRIAHGG